MNESEKKAIHRKRGATLLAVGYAAPRPGGVRRLRAPRVDCGEEGVHSTPQRLFFHNTSTVERINNPNSVKRL